jgi:serine/threonine-protein kinase
MSDEAPSMVADRYRLDERIGSGPMGEIWRGYDTRADWTVAVRLMTGDLASREALQRHAQAVARVIHPNVAMVLDVGEQDGTPYLVTEFLTGESLEEEAAARGPLDVAEVCDLMGQAAGGLDAAHRAGVAHGKVEPGSFRRAGSGVLKVVGFEPAGRPPEGRRLRYAAPERLEGRPAEPPADLYALGCVCYELLCGRPPFEGSDEEVAEGHRAAQPVPPSRHRPEVPAELDRLVLALLAKDPAARPAGGEPVRRALASIARPGSGPVPEAGGEPVPLTAEASVPVTSPSPAIIPAPVPRTGDHLRHGPPSGARAGDTAVYELAPEEPAPGSNRRLYVQLAAALAVIVAVTAGMVIWGSTRDRPVAGPTPSSAPATSAPPSSAPPTSPSPEPTPTPEPSEISSLTETTRPAPKGTLGVGVPAGGYDRWLRELDSRVTAEEAAGDIEPRTARKAHDKIRKAARKFLEGREEAGLSQVRELAAELRQAQARGNVASGGSLAEFLDDWRL